MNQPTYEGPEVILFRLTLSALSLSFAYGLIENHWRNHLGLVPYLMLFAVPVAYVVFATGIHMVTED